MQFKKPDEKIIAQMTPRSLKVLISTLKDQREDAVRPHDARIAYYEKLLKQKEEQDAKATS